MVRLVTEPLSLRSSLLPTARPTTTLLLAAMFESRRECTLKWAGLVALALGLRGRGRGHRTRSSHQEEIVQIQATLK